MLDACRHRAIIRTNVDIIVIGLYDIRLRTISYNVPEVLISKMNLNIIHL